LPLSPASALTSVSPSSPPFLGQAFFSSNQFNESKRCFERILEIGSSDLEVTVSPIHLLSSSQGTWGEGMKSIQIPCSVSYWLAHVFAAEESFLDHEGEESVHRVIGLLQNTLQCLKTVTSISGERDKEREMKRYAREQIQELGAFLLEKSRAEDDGAMERVIEAH
jgi:hypothetical protein